MQCRASLQKRKQLGGVVIQTSTQTADGEVHLVESRQLMGGGLVQAQVRSFFFCLFVLYPVKVNKKPDGCERENCYCYYYLILRRMGKSRA